MKILFDNATPKPIAAALTGHEVTYARQIGWHELRNGELIEQAEQAGYHVLLTTDKNIRYQQNLIARKHRHRGARQSAMAGRPGQLHRSGHPAPAWQALRVGDRMMPKQEVPAFRLHLDRIASAINAATPAEIKVMHPDLCGHQLVEETAEEFR